jgi:menaquinone-specific isochorismate synthase
VESRYGIALDTKPVAGQHSNRVNIPNSVLRTPIECRNIAWHTERVLEACWDWHAEHDLNELLDTASAEWRVLFQAKGSQARYYGVGALCFANLADLDRPSAAELAFYGGVPFHSNETPSELWGQLGRERFFAPVLEWEIRPSSQKLRARMLVDGNEVRAADVERLRVDAQLWLSRVLAGTSAAPRPSFSVESQRQEVTRRAWHDLVNDILADIQRGRLEKAVPARALTLSCAEPLELGAFARALEGGRQPLATYLIGIVEPGGRAYLSLSPERLLSWSGQRVCIDTLAGTRPRAEELLEDARLGSELQHATKDLLEHRVVTRHVRERLSAHCDEIAVLADEAILKLADVQHLHSAFAANCRPQSSPIQLLRALHPTPAVGGHPTQTACELLQRREPLARGWFGGGVGRLDGKSGEFALGIRCAVVCQRIVTLFAGAGIVQGSDASAEWSETEAKMQTFLRHFSSSCASLASR